MGTYTCVRFINRLAKPITSALMAVLSITLFCQIALAADPGVWTVKAPMPTARIHPVVESINGLIYVAGGLNSTTSLNVLEVYDPVTNTWTPKAGMPTVRSGAASGVINGKLYVVGGGNNVTRQVFNVLEVYDPVTNSWTTKKPMPTARQSLGLGVIGGKLYAVGGDNGGSYLTVIEIYDPATDTWTTGAPMLTARNGSAVQVIDGKLYVASGGNSSGYPVVLEVYDPTANVWNSKSSLPSGRQYAASGVIGGRFYVVGGIGSVGNGSADNLSYSPVTNTWRVETAAITGRWGMQGTVINETLYVIGGGVGRASFTPQVANEAFSVRALRVISDSGAAAGTVTLPIELVSRGDENAISFSLAFNPSVLSNPLVTLGSDTTGATLNLNNSRVAQGRLGIALALSTNQKLSAGARQIANVTFTIAANAVPGTTLVDWDDVPIPRQVVDVNANVLPYDNTPGAVTVTPGFEADVSPRPNGNSSVTVADWVQIGRFSAGLETAVTGGGFNALIALPKPVWEMDASTSRIGCRPGDIPLALTRRLPRAGRLCRLPGCKLNSRRRWTQRRRRRALFAR
ncbi:MAG: kelch repeat-containing protein [Acidobacteriota bacterium]